ncbi:MAG: adenosylcobinamide-GDP ribazoletransferase [Aminipila sp.]
MRYITAFFMAWGNFFAIPCPCKLWDNNLRRLQLVFFPLIGIMMGIIWYFLYKGMMLLGLPVPIQSAILTVYPFIISGFIHLDGFMDCCDAILSRRDLEERQRILKDSHVGAFSVISVVILFMMFYSAIWSEMGDLNGLDPVGKGPFSCLIIIPFLTRACSAFGVLKFVPIGHSQYKASYDKDINKEYLIILTLLLGIPLVLLAIGRYWMPLLVAVITIASHFIVMWHGRKQLGGMSGDIAGYALTIAECAGVTAMAIL